MFMTIRTEDRKKPRICIDVEYNDTEYPFSIYLDRAIIYLNQEQADELATKLNQRLQHYDRHRIGGYFDEK